MSLCIWIYLEWVFMLFFLGTMYSHLKLYPVFLCLSFCQFLVEFFNIWYFFFYLGLSYFLCILSPFCNICTFTYYCIYDLESLPPSQIWLVNYVVEFSLFFCLTADGCREEWNNSVLWSFGSTGYFIPWIRTDAINVSTLVPKKHLQSWSCCREWLVNLGYYSIQVLP